MFLPLYITLLIGVGLKKTTGCIFVLYVLKENMKGEINTSL